MIQYSIELRTRKYAQGYEFLSFARNFSNKDSKQLLDTGLDALKTASKKVVHKAAEATGKFIRNKIADKIVKQILVIDENSGKWLEIISEIIISQEKREEVFKK